VLLRHPKVADCAVFGVPHDVAGEVVAAVVQLSDGTAQDRELNTDILRFLADKLALAKVPRRITYTSDTLRDATGKVSKARLRETYARPAPRGGD
jgi:long-chain acyl-CoA synthetase